MTDLVRFGDPGRFEIAVRWTHDHEPRERRPAHGGWSTGELRLTVGNYVLTRHERGQKVCDTVQWYLLPVFEWLAKQWISLLHEERFGWRENSAAPAATAVFLALRRLIDSHEASSEAAYARVQDWWFRHALRAADSSALYPDVVIRRFIDDVEISWTARQPIHAPDGFRFALSPGAATLPIAEVAGPLWEALAWAVSCPPQLEERDRGSIVELERMIVDLAKLSTVTLEGAYLPRELFQKVEEVRAEQGLQDKSVRVTPAPAISRIDDAVLMFGGVNPDVGASDARDLIALLISQRGGTDNGALSRLVKTSIGAPLSAPFEEGYELAEELLEALEMPGDASAVDIEGIVERLGIDVVRKPLRTATIRGVAIAGEGYAPAIFVNTTSLYNAIDAGRRFTMAHELFHVLYDRERARRITHTSGPWAAPGIEKRANAFAAMLLMPRDLVRRSMPIEALDRDGLFHAASLMRVGPSALLEHLYNIDLLDEILRDELRTLVSAR
ncbi:MAG: ImmA/IrrE family metallo-endopeptidase [Acidisphaera sp.]|nr:ImmA/IrrE family metallo-endopeptidase [Acidisphaera sp.]